MSRRAEGEKRDLLLSEALEALEIYGIPAARSALASSVEEASEAAEEIGYPVAIKIIADQISHKSDVGGVQLNLRNREAVAAAFEDMMTRIHKAYPEVKIDGVLVQPMVTGGRELILGGRQDPQFGPVVLVGLGGIFVEIFGEVALRDKPSDIEAVVEALLRTSQLLQDFPEIEELDINPLRVFHDEDGCLALDARIVLK
jgi:acyl-CoA synthetase (NDP forming)